MNNYFLFKKEVLSRLKEKSVETTVRYNEQHTEDLLVYTKKGKKEVCLDTAYKKNIQPEMVVSQILD